MIGRTFYGPAPSTEDIYLYKYILSALFRDCFDQHNTKYFWKELPTLPLIKHFLITQFQSNRFVHVIPYSRTLTLTFLQVQCVFTLKCVFKDYEYVVNQTVNFLPQCLRFWPRLKLPGGTVLSTAPYFSLTAPLLRARSACPRKSRLPSGATFY